jgi:hypothetical protein
LRIGEESTARKPTLPINPQAVNALMLSTVKKL